MNGVIRMPQIGRKLIDVKFGFALMRDRRVPLRCKAGAFLIGLLLTGIVETLEIPVEGMLAAMLPVLGIAGDFAIDGAELVAGPILLAHILLPWIAPKDIVERIRAERTGDSGAKGRVVDI
jgi:hypothetical protein